MRAKCHLFSQTWRGQRAHARTSMNAIRAHSKTESIVQFQVKFSFLRISDRCNRKNIDHIVPARPLRRIQWAQDKHPRSLREKLMAIFGFGVRANDRFMKWISWYGHLKIFGYGFAVCKTLFYDDNKLKI